MVTGRVTGNVWASRRLGEVPAGALLEITLDRGDERIVAFDVLGCGIGERVLVTRGSVAASWFANGAPPIDALVIGSVDETGESNESEE
jgi:ethanolamine utilization protein EutN